MRINARLDDSRARKIVYLTSSTKLSVSEIVKRAIDLYYERVQREASKGAQLLESGGFVGCAEGPSDLSESYKEELFGALEAKLDHR